LNFLQLQHFDDEFLVDLAVFEGDRISAGII